MTFKSATATDAGRKIFAFVAALPIAAALIGACVVALDYATMRPF